MHIEPVEEKLFSQLLEYNKKLNLGIVYRVAGGWVRDRLMGIASHDVDITIDRSSGAVFAKGFMQYLHEKSESVRGYYAMAANPEKSKHLETASLQYKGLLVDFVALRTEEYTDTRIPAVRTGTPQEDANRRDITINSLFYNINTGEVEDLTGKGLDDIKNKKIRTPLDPMVTFMDDPLRILRVLRFAARLSFEIVPEVLGVLDRERLHAKLKAVVSKERVGHEIKKTLAHSGYKIALLAMVKYRIAAALFPGIEISHAEVQEYTHALEAMEKEEGHPLHSIEEKNMYIVRLFSLLQNNQGVRAGKASLTEHVVAEFLRWTKAERAHIVQIEAGVSAMERLLKMDVEERDRQVRMARELKQCLPEAFCVYDALQRMGKLRPASICALYADIVSSGYIDAYLRKPVVSYALLKSKLQLSPDKTAMCVNRCVELSIIHSTEDTEQIIRILCKEMQSRPL
ncbi:uncharacterized protein NEMAJ01_0409 [Nematocida major]|uniref:uncharacterized protein n=1 Tax=Nematocida major TaxID=1912982 RepID=UPI0020087493|nr:uncharacterized protein NEMAJ01_0409 [Nematocida major]KAH9385513.1 hypothetical protein NEMAJ01_0409 [Nematocida major]